MLYFIHNFQPHILTSLHITVVQHVFKHCNNSAIASNWTDCVLKSVINIVQKNFLYIRNQVKIKSDPFGDITIRILRVLFLLLIPTTRNELTIVKDANTVVWWFFLCDAFIRVDLLNKFSLVYMELEKPGFRSLFDTSYSWARLFTISGKKYSTEPIKPVFLTFVFLTYVWWLMSCLITISEI